MSDGSRGYVAGLFFRLATENFRKDDSYGPGMHRLQQGLLKGISLRIFSSATFGLLVGFIFARLLLASDVLRGLDEEWRWITSLGVYAMFSYLGMMLAVRSNRDEFSLIVPYVRFRRATMQDEPLVVDSSVIIDGRLTELCATGFVSSSLVIPRFVLEELQRLADSADPLKRERGRTALERLEQMQANPALGVTIQEIGDDMAEIAVDAKLVSAAKLLDARLLTNDANLASIARLQGVQTLNLHTLDRAMRPLMEPGHPMDLALVKEGRSNSIRSTASNTAELWSSDRCRSNAWSSNAASTFTRGSASRSSRNIRFSAQALVAFSCTIR